MPTELDVISRKIIQLEIEESALKKEEDERSKARLAELQKELADMREDFNARKSQWENEKNAIGKVQELRKQIDQAKKDLELAQRSYDYEKAGAIQYSTLPQLQKQLEAEEQLAAQGAAISTLACFVVTPVLMLLL